MKEAEVVIGIRELSDEVEVEKMLSKLLENAGVPARVDVSIKRKFDGATGGLRFRLVPLDSDK